MTLLDARLRPGGSRLPPFLSGRAFLLAPDGAPVYTGAVDNDALGFLQLRERAGAIPEYCRRRSQGFCEGCGDLAPRARLVEDASEHAHPLALPMLCDGCHITTAVMDRLVAIERALDRGRFRLVTAAMLFDGAGRLFLARRGPRVFLAGLWEFPGGKADPGESLAACLERELVEELGCRPTSLAPLAMVDHPYPEVDLWIRLVGFTGEADPGSILPVEHDATAWVRRHELEQHPLAPADVPLARRITPRVAA